MSIQPASSEESTDLEYKYEVQLGSPKEHRIFFGYGNHFFKNPGQERVLTFPSMGDFYYHNWAEGSDAVSIFSKAELPDGVVLKWFSPFEDQIWKGRFTFNTDFMARLKAHHVNNLLLHFKENFISNSTGFDFIINAVPGGMVFVWISSAGEQYLIGQGRGAKTDEDEWARYILALGSFEPRQELIEERLSLQSEDFQKSYREGTLDLTPNRWLRMMERYPLELVGNEHYKIKDYFGMFVNGEEYHVYEKGGNPLRDTHAVPYEFFLFIEGTDEKKRTERVRLRFDKEVAMSAFEKVSDPQSTLPLTLQISFNYEINKVDIYLSQGERKEKIPFLRSFLEDI